MLPKFKNIIQLLVLFVLMFSWFPSNQAQASTSSQRGNNSIQEWVVDSATDTTEPDSWNIFLPLIEMKPENRAPNIPSNPNPVNNASNVSMDINLTWTGGDLDGDTVTYDVLLEAHARTPKILVSNDQTGTSYKSMTLDANTIYFWQVIAQDAGGAVTPGPVWTFTTGTMVLIPSGNFQMGCDPAHNDGYPCASIELPLHTVFLDAYHIDKYEVTNIQYSQCVAERGCVAPLFNSSSTRTSYYNNPTYANYPVIYVSWDSAVSYCAWTGKRLPTEAEWEKAARGTTVITYPWGDQAPYCHLANGGGCSGDTTAQGSYPAGASPYGVINMGGNVAEWVNDWYSPTYYGSQTHWNNPIGPSSGTDKVLRGGSMNRDWYNLRVANRDNGYRGGRLGNIGFRCVDNPKK